MGRQLARARQSPPAVGFTRARRRDPLHQPDRGAVANIEVSGGNAARVARRDEGDDALAKSNR